MKLPLLFAAILTLPLAAHAQTPAETEAIHKQILANDEACGKAIRIMDFATLATYWSPDMHVNSPGNNILSRDQVFQAMRENKLKYSGGKTTPELFYVVNDTAVEMGYEVVVMANGPMAGKPMTRRFTDVWQRTGDKWVQIAARPPSS